MHVRPEHAPLRPIGSLIALFFVILFALPAKAQTPLPWVAVLPGGNSLSNMLLQCVKHYQGQGLSLKQATGQCMAIGVMRRSGSSGFGLDSGFMSSSAGPSAVECTTLGLDPRFAQTVSRPPNTSYPGLGKPLPKLSDLYDVQKALYSDLVFAIMIDIGMESSALRDQIAITTDPLQKQILQDKQNSLAQLESDLFDQEAQDWYANQLFEAIQWREDHPGTPQPGDHPLPDPDAPQIAHVSDQAVSGCQIMRDWVSECRLAGWKTGPCQMFIDRLAKCGDPTITDPSPDEERTCRARPVDAATIKRVAFLACSKNTTPGPGADPCSDTGQKGLLFHFNYDRPDSRRPMCSNPFAYTDADACNPTFSVLVSPQPSVDELIKTANERLGGPFFVLPLPSVGGLPHGGPGVCYKGLPGC